MTDTTFHRRVLPRNCIQFSSKEGKAIFRESFLQGNLDMYFPLSEVFNKQSEPAYCGVSTLCMILNCLSMDPTVVHGARGVWKGPWRWYHEELLDCCRPLEYVKANGVSMEELNCLAQCNGLDTTVVSMADSDVTAFREHVIDLSKQSDPPSRYLVVNYDRKVLGQTGSGHFSPIAAYEATRDMVLICDVAQFKYPPHWVSLPDLVRAMESVDPETSRPRGYMTLSRGVYAGTACVFTLSGPASPGEGVWDMLREWVESGLRTTADDLYTFIKLFRENYNCNNATYFLGYLKDSALFTECPYSSNTLPQDSIDCIDFYTRFDASNPEVIDILDRISWTLIIIAVDWCNSISEATHFKSVSADHGCATTTKCLNKLRMRPGPKHIPTIVCQNINISEANAASLLKLSIESSYDIIINELAFLTRKLLVLPTTVHGGCSDGECCK